MDARIAIIAMTTRSSMRVKAALVVPAVRGWCIPLTFYCVANLGVYCAYFIAAELFSLLPHGLRFPQHGT